jgi:hypothetical protein
MPLLNVHLDIWDCVESYTAHMLLPFRQKFTLSSNLKLIISFLVLPLVLLHSYQPLLFVASRRHAPLTLRVYLRWPFGLVQAADNLEQDTLPWRVLKVRKEGNNAILDIVLKLLIIHAPFIIHPNSAQPFPLLLTSKPATCVEHMAQELEVKPFPFFCCHAQQ